MGNLNIFNRNRQPEFYYEDLVVTQIDLVNKPATGDKFLSVRSEDGTIENVPIIRSSLNGIVKNTLNDSKLTIDEIGEEKMAKSLEEVLERIERAAGDIKEASSKFNNVINLKQPGEIKGEKEDKVEDTVSDEAKDESAPSVPEDSKDTESKDSTEATESAPKQEDAPADTSVDEAPAPAAQDAPADAEAGAEPTVEVAVRSAVENLAKNFEELSANFTKVTDRLNSIERSVTVPNTAPVDDNHEKVEREVTSVFSGVIRK